VVYKEMRTPGQAEDLYRKAQEAGVTFIRSQDPEVQASDNKLAVEADDELLGEKVLLDDLDMVVLATGMVPVSAFGPDITQEAKEEEEEAKKEEEEIEVPPDLIRRSNILNLDYRQGPEAPALMYDFPDSHFICFPYESRRTGIYAAGCVRRPMGSASTGRGFDLSRICHAALHPVQTLHRGMSLWGHQRRRRIQSLAATDKMPAVWRLYGGLS